MNKKYIFLDIDGVLRPFIQYHPIRTKKENLGHFLSKEYHDVRYECIDEGTLHTVMYDFHPEAIQTIKELMKDEQTYIILTTSWRLFHSLQDMKLLFKLHNIDHIIDQTPALNSRQEEIIFYLEHHPEIIQYVIIDDIPLKEHFPDHAYTTHQYLKSNDKAEILKILNYPHNSY